MYKIMDPAPGCNTGRMIRVVRNEELVALFLSLYDAQAYIKSKT